MAPKLRTIHQNLLDDDFGVISVQEDVLESHLCKQFFDDLFADIPSPRVVGLAPIYLENGTLTRLALAVTNKVVVVQFHAKGKGANAYKGREVLSAEVLCNPDVLLPAFDCSNLAIALYSDQGLRILNGIDVQDACDGDRTPLAAIKFAAGDRVAVMDENVAATFESSVFESRRIASFALQAWIAQCLPTLSGMEARFQAAKRIDTSRHSDAALRVFSQTSRGEQRLAIGARTSVANEYTATRTKHQKAQVKAQRFDTRFRVSATTTQRIVVHDPHTGMDITIRGTVDKVMGRNTTIATDINLDGRTITSIVTEGRDEPTLADRDRESTLRRALQGDVDIFVNPFLQHIFHPTDNFIWPDTFPVSDTIPPIVTLGNRPLNDSQQQAVQAMLSSTNDTRITIIQGPPGTGKTTVIATFVASAVAAGAKGIWLMAQSNIAVKNIAEKLADVGFDKWRLLVSKDFQFDWHDHLYRPLTKNVISTFEFKRASQQIQDIPVILCTLSMLSHPKLHIFTTANPITTMVVDEASQITLGNYVAPLQKFSHTIRKVYLINIISVPPYGADSNEDMRSIFEIEHLRSSIVFLNTQYRMPPLIGDAVSEAIYDSQLQSNPEHPIPYETPSCWFVHVPDSEERPYGTSVHNPAERATVLKIAEKLQAEGKNYAIITPYDSQRSFLEEDMQTAGLVWQDKCFNVDSFQGNEKDFIIVSLVRSKSLGFLADYRRTNVMLTRCKRGMYIVTSWGFVWDKAADTLVGRMAAAWGNDVWVNPEHLTVEA
ncbi:hypothetical protein BN946_scf185015.g45 [Trametes cinnabarina]|uniref:DNA2/NAM7 helicase-like C-terminal domain-containing protein n=1 Tax=Pycnoporus cinnabarinus TaxID=5643 RepID=A0A060SGT7_PYCCI|nr:hypothetical protein BN946_scf185015.g45 [Trametes cinnabarina]